MKFPKISFIEMPRLEKFLEDFFLPFIPLIFLIIILIILDYFDIDANVLGKEFSTITIVGIITTPYTLLITINLYIQQRNHEYNMEDFEIKKDIYKKVLSLSQKLNYWTNYLIAATNSVIIPDKLDIALSKLSDLQAELSAQILIYIALTTEKPIDKFFSLETFQTDVAADNALDMLTKHDDLITFHTNKTSFGWPIDPRLHEQAKILIDSYIAAKNKVVETVIKEFSRSKKKIE